MKSHFLAAENIRPPAPSPSRICLRGALHRNRRYYDRLLPSRLYHVRAFSLVGVRISPVSLHPPKLEELRQTSVDKATCRSQAPAAEAFPKQDATKTVLSTVDCKHKPYKISGPGMTPDGS